MKVCLAALAATLLCACGPDLGSCDAAEARRIVYDAESGDPAFEGQALMIRSCGNGGFCHSEGIALDRRYGAPASLDYDLRLASNSSATEPESTERLRRMQARAFTDRHSIWDAVSSGRMPILIRDGRDDPLSGAPVYEHRDLRADVRTPAATLDDDAGMEAMRNWLACGLPVVERTEPADAAEDPIPAVGTIVTSQEDPLLANWDDIYGRLLGTNRCASEPCHSVSGPDDVAEGELDLLGGPAETLARLLAGRTSRPETPEAQTCDANIIAWLIPGDPEGSLLFQKLTGVDADGEQVCGGRMPDSGSPVSEPSMEAIRQWIADGANP